MILGDDLTPVSKLSSAFLTPKSDLHVQFAYYQSALVVEYLVGKFGFASLQGILRDLANGTEINDAIAKHTAPMKQIETEFAAFAKARAEALAPELDWKKPAQPSPTTQALGMPELKLPAPDPANSKNYWVLMDSARTLIAAKKWEEAKVPLQTLIKFYPDQSGLNNAYALLATVHRNLNETAAERAALEKWAALEADALDAYSRLMELAATANDWLAVAQNAERTLAVNPLGPQPYRALATASEALGETSRAINAYEKLLLLDPPDPADVHFKLAKLLKTEHASNAKRHALQALEEAPRFRAAHQLLLELAHAETSPTNPAAPQQIP
jgi:tetratricopeptide (TPR) repeat protein